jgi:hypothetical protein
MDSPFELEQKCGCVYERGKDSFYKQVFLAGASLISDRWFMVCCGDRHRFLVGR